EVTYEAVDLSGNMTACSFTVTVNDEEAPELTCPDDIDLVLPDGDCEAVVNFTPPTGTDNCAVASVIQTEGIAPGELFAVGTTTVTYEATDDAGNTATCSFEVTLTENVAPEITCPDDITVNNDPGECAATVTYTAPVGTDNCPGAVTTLTEGPASGAEFPEGTTTVTYTVTDLSGNEASCSFTVTVIDAENPVFACPEPITLEANDGACGTEAVFDIPTATDNCDDTLTPVQVSGPAPGDFIAVGNAEAVFEVTDAAGNTAECIISIEVIDNENPVITCPDDLLIDAEAGDCDAVVVYDIPTATDNCDIDDVVLSAGIESGGTFPSGETTVTYTATDVNGNSAECSFTVTVVGALPPVITCPDNITVANDQGTCGAVVTYDPPSTADGCGDITLELIDGPASGSEFPEGTTSVTFQATDASGNSAQCTFEVTVNDEEDPVFDCPANVNIPADEVECGAVYVFDLPDATDNCDADLDVVQTAGPASGSLLDLGETIYTFTATDEAGNVAECSYTVEVTDNEAPVFEDCPEDFTLFVGTETCVVEITYPTPLATDNCSAEVTLTSGPESGEELGPGSYDVVFDALDPSGNTAECSFTVNVADTIAPVFACPDTIQSCEFNVVFDAPEATDNCEIADVIQTGGPESGTSFPLGFTTVTFEATDLSGNTSECSFVIERLAAAPRAEVGNNQNICGSTSAFLNANDPGDEALGTWIFESGFGIIVDENDPNTEVQDLGVGFNVFVWFIDPLNGCDSQPDRLTRRNHPIFRHLHFTPGLQCDRLPVCPRISGISKYNHPR
ncbi:MAG: HYR domain-containing protein, partial [Flavobacteriales bacterium]|nr:HYR domain-containing protein [Flavobacteriales bacterium]